VCRLCTGTAVDPGWVKEGVALSPIVQQPLRRRRQRSLWQSLLGTREEEVEPVVSEPILRRLGDDEIALVEAAELFNATQFRRTIAGVAKALGEPQASITPLSGVNSEMVLTFAWDITWYQYRGSPEPAGAPGCAGLRVRWLLAPHRRATAALLANADVPVAPPAPTLVTTANTPATDAATATDGAERASAAAPIAPLPTALAAHLELAKTTTPDGKTFAAAIEAWDAALVSGETQKWLARRALELDAPLGAIDRALKDVATSVTDELARLADSAKLAAPAAHGPVGGSLARRIRHGRLDALEAGFNRWELRRHDGTVHAPIDEWREYVALRAAYEAAVASGGLELRRIAFPHAYSKGTSMAVWLWNSRNEYALSHAISSWLLDEALVVGDTEAIDLCTRNTRLTVPTRTGDVKKGPRET